MGGLGSLRYAVVVWLDVLTCSRSFLRILVVGLSGLPVATSLSRGWRSSRAFPDATGAWLKQRWQGECATLACSALVHLHVLVCGKAARGLAPYARLVSFRGAAHGGHDVWLPGSVTADPVPYEVLNSCGCSSYGCSAVPKRRSGRSSRTSTKVTTATKVQGGLD